MICWTVTELHLNIMYGSSNAFNVYFDSIK